MTSLELLQEMIKNARIALANMVVDVTVEMMHVDPGNKAMPLGATWAHIIFSEDVFVHGLLQGKPSLFDADFKDNTGASSSMPPLTDTWNENTILWAKSVKFDLAKFKEYQKSVFYDTDTYIRGLHDDELVIERDLGLWGKKPLWSLLNDFIIAHMLSGTGEISVLKGLQGYHGSSF